MAADGYDPEFHEQQGREHAAWLDVVEELRAAGAGDINAGGENESVAHAVVKWGEELAQLRYLDRDPQHREDALAEKRAGYEGEIYRQRFGSPEPA